MYFQWILKWYSYQPWPSLGFQKSGGWKMVWLDRQYISLHTVVFCKSLLWVTVLITCCWMHMPRVECMNINSLQCIACGTLHTLCTKQCFADNQPSCPLTLPSISAHAGFTVDVAGITHEWSVRGAADPTGPDAGPQPHPHPGLHPHLWAHHLSHLCQVPPVEEVGVPF